MCSGRSAQHSRPVRQLGAGQPPAQDGERLARDVDRGERGVERARVLDRQVAPSASATTRSTRAWLGSSRVRVLRMAADARQPARRRQRAVERGEGARRRAEPPDPPARRSATSTSASRSASVVRNVWRETITCPYSTRRSKPGACWPLEQLGDRPAQQRADDARVGVATDRRDPVAGQLQHRSRHAPVLAGRTLGAAGDVQPGERAASDGKPAVAMPTAGPWVDVRFDVVSILLERGCEPEISHLEGVF